MFDCAALTNMKLCCVVAVVFFLCLSIVHSSEDITAGAQPSSIVDRLRSLTSLNKRVRSQLQTLIDDDVIEVELQENPSQLVVQAIEEAQKERKTHLTYVILNFGSGLKRGEQR